MNPSAREYIPSSSSHVRMDWHGNGVYKDKLYWVEQNVDNLKIILSLKERIHDLTNTNKDLKLMLQQYETDNKPDKKTKCIENMMCDYWADLITTDITYKHYMHNSDNTTLDDEPMIEEEPKDDQELNNENDAVNKNKDEDDENIITSISTLYDIKQTSNDNITVIKNKNKYEVFMEETECTSEIKTDTENDDHETYSKKETKKVSSHVISKDNVQTSTCKDENTNVNKIHNEKLDELITEQICKDEAEKNVDNKDEDVKSESTHSYADESQLITKVPNDICQAAKAVMLMKIHIRNFKKYDNIDEAKQLYFDMIEKLNKMNKKMDIIMGENLSKWILEATKTLKNVRKWHEFQRLKLLTLDLCNKIFSHEFFFPGCKLIYESKKFTFNEEEVTYDNDNEEKYHLNYEDEIDDDWNKDSSYYREWD